MSDLAAVFNFIAGIIGEYLLMMNSNWLTQVILYLVVLGVVVSTILVMRGR